MVVKFGPFVTLFGYHSLGNPADLAVDLGFWALSGRPRAAFEHDQAAHVIGEVLHPDLHAGARDANGAHELAAHAGLLATEHMLDPRPH